MQRARHLIETLPEKGRLAWCAPGALLLVVLLGFFSAAGVSPELHRWICPEAGQPDDQCVIRVLATGLLLSSCTQVDAAVVARAVPAVVRPAVGVPRTLPVDSLSAPRAPPLILVL
jgi:hypothetical protein